MSPSDPASPPLSPSRDHTTKLERRDTADSMNMQHMAHAVKSSGEAVEAPASPAKRRGGRRGAPTRGAPTRGAPMRGRGSGSSDKRSVLRCTTADSMEMKAMQNGLRAAPVSAEGNGDDADDSERPPSPTDDGPPIVGILLDCEEHSASSIEDDDE
jgi:hypothetical protein